MKKIFLVAMIISALAAPLFVSAQGIKDAGKILTQIANPSQTGLSDNLGTAVAAVIKTVLALVGTIFLILTVYAGIMWMTAQGDEERVTKAKDIIKASVIGLIIIMSAYAITFFVTSKLGGANSSPSTTNNVGYCSDVDGACRTTCATNESVWVTSYECAPQSCCVPD